MNKHDQNRKNALVKTLLKAKEKAEIMQLYLTANKRDQEGITAVNLTLEHIEIALEHLSVLKPEEQAS